MACDNSIQRQPTIQVCAYEDKAQVYIVIDDNGPGLPEKIKRDPFTAFHGTTKSGGSGLGLAISAELINLQGGALVYEEMPEGARFRFILPNARQCVVQT